MGNFSSLRHCLERPCITLCIKQKTKVMDSTPDWAYLPPEILQHIARMLTEICDFIRFRAVCAAWRVAISPTDLIQPQRPWLILSEHTFTSFAFHSLSNQERVYTPVLTDVIGKWILASSKGWLLVIGKSMSCKDVVSVSLLNPITRAEILLPRWASKLEFNLMQAVICSPVAFAQPEQVLVVLLLGNTKWAFTRKGDELWTIVDSSPSGRELRQIVAVEDTLYVGDIDGRVAILQMPPLKVSRLISGPRHPQPSGHYRLVEAAGDLLLLQWSYGCDTRLSVFKLAESGKEEVNWVMQGFTDIAAFCRYRRSSICARVLPDGRGYRIYLAQHCGTGRSEIRVIDVVPGSGIIEHTCYKVPGEWLAHFAIWMEPSLH